LTETNFTFLATPYDLPPIVPATWVPWPRTSSTPAAVSGVTKLGPLDARPSNSSWSMLMPVSRM
jgi:hypothetical protein